MARLGIALGVALLAMVAAIAPGRAQETLGARTSIEDPSGRVLPRLHEALRRARDGQGVARLAFWGASHTASDQYTSFLRASLQRRFGDAGAGLVLPALPFSLYERRDVRIESGGGWRGAMVRGAAREPDRYGRAGFALDTERRTWARVHAAPRTAHVELWALAQPGGATLELRADGAAHVTTLATEAPEPALAYAVLDVPPGAHRVEVRALGDGRARVFGVLLESDRPGVIVESFGVPGARAHDQLAWDQPTLRAHLARRPPDLYALAYGTNESGDRTALPTLERDLRAVLMRWRAAAPDAACLVIGPSDWPRTRAGVLEPRPRTTAVRDTYRRVALAERCAFFDLLAFQGGPGAITRWVSAGWALGDHVHMTDPGHERLAHVLERALLRGL